MALTKTTVHSPPTQIKTILLVEDNPDQQALIQLLVDKTFRQTKLVQTTTGPQALAYLDRCLELGQNLPQLVLLDLYLPEREDGWRVLEGIRSLPAPYNSLPVIILSSSCEPADIRSAYEHRVTSYLVKPIEPEDWTVFFQILKEYWDQTVALPGMRLF